MDIHRVARTCTSAIQAFVGDRKRLWVTMSTLAIVGGGALVFVRARGGSAERGGASASSPIVPPVAAATIPRWLDGFPLPEGTEQPRAVAVVIDNAPEAQPQAGLAAAPLVFEVPVEGRRTRFLAVYPVTAPMERIGPVRSARPYLVGLANALGAPLVHVGGSPAALALLKTRPHVNQYYDPPFMRDRARAAPFNVFTALPELRTFLGASGWRETFSEVLHPSPWPFSETLSAELAIAAGRDIRIPFSTHESSFVVDWKYDEAEGVYIRRRGGAVVRDADGAEVSAENVVLLSVRSRVLDRVGRLAIPALEPPITASYEGFINSGRAAVFRDGKRIDGQWSWEQAPSDGGRFGIRQVQDIESGKSAFLPIPLAPGTTWVEIIDFKWE